MPLGPGFPCDNTTTTINIKSEETADDKIYIYCICAYSQSRSSRFAPFAVYTLLTLTTKKILSENIHAIKAQF